MLLPLSPSRLGDVGGEKLPTPVNAHVFAELLDGYEKKDFIVNGFKNGFFVNFEGDELEVDSPNSKAALDNPEAVDSKLAKELEANRIAGPFEEPPFENFRSYPLSIREKSTPGQYRLLHNLSYPYDDRSINANIADEFATTSYATIHDAMQLILKLGRGCFLAKSDIKSAFRIVPIHPSQYHLMGFKWRGKYYFDKCLAMGLRSSCQIFETVSSAILYILQKHYNVHDVVKVLDDFLFAAITRERCQSDLDAFLKLCVRLGVPVAMEKTELPAQLMVFLGILLTPLG